MIDGYISEKEQIESMKKWWQEQGKYIAIAVVIGLLLGFGWRYWRALEIRRAENASMIYQSVLNADAKKDTLTAQGGAIILMREFPKLPYASLAALLWVKEAVMNNQLDVALSKLSWVMDHSTDSRFVQMAHISKARILLAQNKAEEALQQLNAIKGKDFEPLVHWVSGDIYAHEGKTELAAQHYSLAKSGLISLPSAAAMMDMKLAQPLVSTETH